GQHPAVRAAVVLAREDRPGAQRLVAYVVGAHAPTEAHAPTAGEARRDPQAGALSPVPADLRAFLAARLPEYMVPSAFVVLEALPLTPNGKVDRQALPTPTESPSTQPGAYTAPRTPTEEVLINIWTQVLNLSHSSDQPGLGVHDHFFALGGHSLSAMQAIFRAHEVFQVELTLQHLFEAPTIAQFAEVIEKARQNGIALHSPAIVRLDRNRHRSKIL
ncbi:MAG TPA: phosphopantetheine-binding protein, partial [Herpetosiphonaceae bacterium]